MIIIKNKYFILIGIIVTALILVSVFFITKAFNKNDNKNTNNNLTVDVKDLKPARPDIIINSLSVTAKGFEPRELTVKKGSGVVWTNNSGATVVINSDAHPTHLLWPFLNLGRIENKESVSAVFDKKGTYTYHNHLNPTQTGTIIVE